MSELGPIFARLDVSEREQLKVEARITALERDRVDHSKSLTEITTHLAKQDDKVVQLETFVKVREERDKLIDAKFAELNAALKVVAADSKERLDNNANLTRWAIGLIVAIGLAFGGWIVSGKVNIG